MLPQKLPPAGPSSKRRRWQAMTAEDTADGPVGAAIAQLEQLTYRPARSGEQPVRVRSGQAARGARYEISGDRREAQPKGGGTKLQAVRKLNPAASKLKPVRDRAGRAWVSWAKAAVRALDSGAARNRSGVEGSACSEGRPGDWGDPTAPVGRSIAAEACPGIRPQPKSRAVPRESHRAVVVLTPETTQLGAREGPGLR